MIDRKALWVTGLMIIAMTTAALWRVSLLADRSHMTLSGPAQTVTVPTLALFISPLCLLFVVAVLIAQKWFVSGPEEAMRPWHRWGRLMLVSYGVILALMQANILGRSFGVGVPLSRPQIARIGFVVTGGLIVVLGNALPKLPWLSARLSFWRLDPWQWARHRRFMGKITVVMGFGIIVGGALLPLRLVAPALICLWLAVFTASIWYRMKLRRDPSPLP